MAKTLQNTALSKSIGIPNSPQICRACLSTENLLKMEKLVKVELHQFTCVQLKITDLYRNILSAKVPIPENVDGLICHDCLEKFKFIFVFLEKCERNLELFEQYSIPKTVSVPVTDVAGVKRRRMCKDQFVDNVGESHSHLCFLCNQAFSTYQALYKHNKVHRPMRCGGGQECRHCRKKFFSQDTLRNHEEACGSFDHYLETEAQLKDEIVVENCMLIKSERFEIAPTETKLDDQEQMELMHIKTEIEDFV